MIDRLAVLVWLGLAALGPLAAQAFPISDLEKTPKSQFFAGRCLAPILLREEVSTKDLREMPVMSAVPHLYGQSGTVWYGPDENVVLVDLDAGASCGINVFDEDLAEVEAFMAYWLERADSPFTEMSTEMLAGGDVRISYDGFCEACGYHVHARAIWVREAQFTIYRVFATLPEKA
ncbi:MAG: hypothetical protein AAFR45_02460 [Pseudomonadota bacterium]